jgi:arsenite oxidase small subunit
LKQDTPVDFQYPDEGAYSESMIVRLGVQAGGGIGSNQDVVAFNYTCTHQGGPLAGTYKADTKSLGACPLHLSTYDLTRYGILISGQAYQSLPQVLLELEGDDVYAVGIFGLIYGRFDNLQG